MTVISMLPVIWLAVILAAIFCEALFESLVAVWFAPAAAIALVCGWFDITPRIQVLVFFVSAVVMITAATIILRVLMLYGKHKKHDTDIE